MPGIIAGLAEFDHGLSRGSKMEASDLKCRPPFQVVTFRDDQEVISEDVESQVAAQTRFASAVDLCKTRDGAHSHRVELRADGDVVARWPASDH